MRNEDEQKARIEYYLNHTLKLNDKFRFTCRQCGNCCRNREEAIMITGVDIYYMSKALGIQQMDFIMNYCETYIGGTSGLPVVVLKENENGDCPLMKNNKCSVHDSKPTVCKIYPLGRFSMTDDGQFKYFLQPNLCAGSLRGEEHTLKQWLDFFNIHQRDEECKQWNKMIYSLSDYLNHHKQDKDYKDLLKIAFVIMYLEYDLSKTFIESLKINKEILKNCLEGLVIADD